MRSAPPMSGKGRCESKSRGALRMNTSRKTLLAATPLSVAIHARGPEALRHSLSKVLPLTDSFSLPASHVRTYRTNAHGSAADIGKKAELKEQRDRGESMRRGEGGRRRGLTAGDCLSERAAMDSPPLSGNAQHRARTRAQRVSSSVTRRERNRAVGRAACTQQRV